MLGVDITCDLVDEDESGFVWTFLREARDPSLIEPGAIVIAGDPDAPAVAEVVDLVDKPAGRVVHLRVLPGAIEDYLALVAGRPPPPEGLAPRARPDAWFEHGIRTGLHRRACVSGGWLLGHRQRGPAAGAPRRRSAWMPGAVLGGPCCPT